MKMRARLRSRRRRRHIVAFAATASAIATFAVAALPAEEAGQTAPAPAAPQSCTLEPGPRRAVARVIDAETVELDDRMQVRLIGAQAPRAPASAGSGAGGAAWPLEQEARSALEALTLGRTVELAYGGRRTDRYGRTLAHVFVVEGAARTWIQGELLAKGHARAYGLPQSYHCMEELTAHERIARQSGLGLWANAAYAPRAATDLAALRRTRNSYQLVVGQVASVRQTKTFTYLNFGPDWRRDFSAVVRIKGLDAGTKQLLAGLASRTILVRGWIERRGGPFIAVDDMSQIEVLPDGAGPGDVAPPLTLQPAAVPPQAETGSVGAPAETAEPQPQPRRSRRNRPASAPPGAVNL